MARILNLRVNDRLAEVEVETVAGELRVRLGDDWRTVQLERTNQSGLYSLLIGGRSYELFARERPGGFELLLGNRVYEIDVGQRAVEEAEREASGAWTLLAPMTGMVVEVRVQAGESVAAGAPLIVIESMKMNNQLTAARAGVVQEIAVAPGERVEKGRLLLRLG